VDDDDDVDEHVTNDDNPIRDRVLVPEASLKKTDKPNIGLPQLWDQCY